MPDITYSSLLKKSFDLHSQRMCLSIKRNGTYQTWSYSQARNDLNSLTATLVLANLPVQFNAVIIGDNTPEWILAFNAAILAGGRSVPIDPNLGHSDIVNITTQTQASVVFCTSVYAPLFTSLKSTLSCIKTIISLDDNSGTMTDIPWSKAITPSTQTMDVFDRSFFPDNPVAIIYTSGTTGTAKGVVLTQRNFTGVNLFAVPRMGISHLDVMVAFLPLYHVFGLAGCVAAALTTGMEVVCVPKLKGPLIVEALCDRHVSIMPAAPQMLELFYDNIQRTVRQKGIITQALFFKLHALSLLLGPIFGPKFRRLLFSSIHKKFGGKVNLIISGGASLKKRYFDGFHRLGFSIVEGYGLTETFGPITLCPAAHPKQASVGPILGDNQISIASPNKDGIGEVLLRGPTVFPGYYNNDVATKAVFDENGWFKTGDSGKLDPDGYLFLTGRTKDVIVLDSGKNVYPDELEAFYSTSDIIEELGIFGRKEQNREVVAAVIVPSKTIRLHTSQEQANVLIRQELVRLDKHLPSYKKIGSFVVSYHPLPRTSIKKIKKTELVSLYASLQADQNKNPAPPELSYIETQLMEQTEFKVIVRHLKQILHNASLNTITPRTHLLFDCKLDSINFVDFICSLEQHFSIAIPEASLMKIETVGDLCGIITELKH